MAISVGSPAVFVARVRFATKDKRRVNWSNMLSISRQLGGRSLDSNKENQRGSDF